MTSLSDGAAGPARTPWHLWVVGVISVLWNAFGCYDYLMTNLQGDAYLRQSGAGMGWTPSQVDAFVAYYNSMPAWMTAVWAVGVWGGLLGAVLLLLRRKLAVPVFLVSLLAYVLSVVNTFILSEAPDFVQSTIGMQVVIFVGCLVFLIYSWWMAKRGVLR